MDVTEQRQDAPERAKGSDLGGANLRTFQKWHGDGRRWANSWRPEAERLEGMVHAYQWTKEEEYELERQGRKALRSPHISKVIWSMVGWQSQNKFDVKYLPRGSSDTGIANARTMIAKYIWDQNQAEYSFGDARISQYTGPMGWYFVGARMDDPAKDPVVLENVPWREMFWDYRAKKLDLSDAKYVGRERWLSYEDAATLYPEKAEELKAYLTTVRQADAAVNEWGMAYTVERKGDRVGPVQTWDESAYLFGEREEVRLVELWWREKKRGHWLNMPDGTAVVFDENDLNHQMTVLMGGTIQSGWVTTIHTATFCGDVLLEHMESPYKHGCFPYVPLWGLIDQKGIPYGVTRLIEDEQLVINYTTSKLLWIAAARQAYVSPTADLEQVAENLAKPDGLVPRQNAGEVEIIRQDDMTALNTGLMTNALNNIREIAGSSDEMRGQDGDAKSGRAILARQNASLRQQGRFLDNEQRCLVQIGQIMASLMDQFYTDEKVLRITEPDGRFSQIAINIEDPLQREQYEAAGIKTYGSIAQGQYDCVVATAPLSPSQREAQAEQFTHIMGNMDPQVRLALLDMWVDVLDLPGKEEMIQRIQQMQQTMLGLQVAKQQAEVQAMQADIGANGGGEQPQADMGQLQQAQASQQMAHADEAHQVQMQGRMLDQQAKQMMNQVKLQQMTQTPGGQSGYQA